ncbi:MAG: hypothetical protein WCR05_11565 [Sphaerochaetaceae bacterium]
MCKKTLFVLFLVMLAGSMLFASGPYSEMIPLSSSVYQDMDELYAIMDMGTPSNARPWSKGEALMILDRVDTFALRGVSKTLYDKIANAVEPGLRWNFADNFGLGVILETNVEYYAHTNGVQFNTEPDWIYGFEQRKPLAKLKLDFSVKDMFYTYADLQYGYGRTNPDDTITALSEFTGGQGVGSLISETDAGSSYYVKDSVVYSRSSGWNIPPRSAEFDFEWPKRAIFSLGGSFWNVSVARDRVDWGNSHIGNFIIDNHVDYHDFFRFSAFSDHFKYEWLNVFFDTNPKSSESPTTSSRILMAHRLEFRPWSWLTFSVSENVMYQADTVNLRYLNPAFIFHNLNNRSMFNAIAHAELDIMLYRGLNLYGQFVLDQARAPNEAAVQSDAWGVLGGFEYSHAVGPGILTTSLEYAYTTPCLYRRDGVDFLMFQKSFTLGKSFVLNLDYIGFPYGGDAQVLQWNISYRMPSYGEIAFSLQGQRHGEMDIFTPHHVDSNGNPTDNSGVPNYAGATPSGDDITETLVASLAGKYEIPHFVSWIDMSIWSRLDWIGRRIHTRSTNSYSGEASDLQFTIGMEIVL